MKHGSLISGARAGVAVLLLMLIVGTASVAPAVAHTAFGLKDLDFTFTNKDGSPVTQAGSHPFAVTTTFDVNTEPNAELGFENPAGAIKGLDIDVPAGLVGNLNAVSRCVSAEFETQGGANGGNCPRSTMLGSETSSIEEPGATFTNPVYNLDPPPGVAAEIGFWVLLVPFKIDFVVNPNPPYNVIARPADIPEVVSVYGSKVTLWGDPASHEHDAERGGPVDGPDTPFLTLPTNCTAPLATTFRAESWEGEFFEATRYSHDNSEPPQPLVLDGCSRLAFHPTIDAQPTSQTAESPSGLDFDLNIKDEGLTSPTGLAQSDIKKAVVTLPEGMTANAALAEGLNVCSEEQLARETVNAQPGEGCPSESKIGTVEVETPLLDEPLGGSLFIAKPYANPFNSLLALYFVFKSPTLGIIIKQPALVEPNPVTGQLVTTVDNIPQLPFSQFKLHFREGARSPLVTPSSCGTYNASAELTPWSGGPAVTTTSAFQIIAGAGGGACPVGVAPFVPDVTAGTLNNDAGNYSEFDLRISRKDGEQELTRFSTTFPPGLTGNLTGIPFCPDSAIEAARQKTGEQELSEPSCPAASEIGHTLVSAGVGPVLAQAPGKVYLAGPYNGSPLSIASITAAKVGPFDLGTVVVRFALRINLNTAQVEVDGAGSDPIPHIIDGIVVNVREIHAYIDRQKFILNSTNCDPMSIQNVVTGAGADFANPADQDPVLLTSPFQAADCSNLAFKPAFQVATAAKASKANGASLTVKLAYPDAPQGTQANIRRVKVDLPKQLPSRLTTLQKACTAAQFHSNPAGCPAASVVGHARAYTPILPVPLEGPAYFVSNGSEAFPNLIMVLQGYGITIDLTGDTDINKAGVTSSTFNAVPDEPVTSFELTLPQGPDSALAANLPEKDADNFCGQKLTVPTAFTAQNGAEIRESIPVTVEGCSTALALVSQKVRSHTVAITVKVPSAGSLTATAKGLTKAFTRVKGNGNITVKLSVTKSERVFLAKRTGRRLRAKVTFKFVAAKGITLTTTTTVLID